MNQLQPNTNIGEDDLERLRNLAPRNSIAYSFNADFDLQADEEYDESDRRDSFIATRKSSNLYEKITTLAKKIKKIRCKVLSIMYMDASRNSMVLSRNSKNSSVTSQSSYSQRNKKILDLNFE